MENLNQITSFFSNLLAVDLSNVTVAFEHISGEAAGMFNPNSATTPVIVDIAKIKELFPCSESLQEIATECTIVHEYMHYTQRVLNKSLVLPIGNGIKGDQIALRFKNSPYTENWLEIEANLVECYYLFQHHQYEEGAEYYTVGKLADFNKAKLLDYAKRIEPAFADFILDILSKYMEVENMEKDMEKEVKEVAEEVKEVKAEETKEEVKEVKAETKSNRQKEKKEKGEFNMKNQKPENLEEILKLPRTEKVVKSKGGLVEVDAKLVAIDESMSKSFARKVNKVNSYLNAKAIYTANAREMAILKREKKANKKEENALKEEKAKVNKMLTEIKESQCPKYVIMTGLAGVEEETKYSFESVDKLIKAKQVLTKKENVRMQKIKIINEDTEYKAVTDLIIQGENDYIRGLKYTSTTITLSNGETKSLGKDKRYISEYIEIEADREFIDSLRFTRVFLTKGNKMLWETVIGGETVYINLHTGKKFKRLPKSAVEYKFFMYTSGTIKEDKSIWCKASIDPKEEQNRHMNRMWDCFDKPIEKNLAAKLAARPGLSFSPNRKMSSSLTVAFFGEEFDKMSCNTTDDVLANPIDVKNKKDEYSNTQDGQAYIDARVIMKMFKLRKEKDAEKVVAQARFLGIVKFQLIAVNHSLFVEMVKKLQNEKPYLLNVVGKASFPQVLCDKNCKKAEFMADGVEGLNLLLMTIGKVSTGRFSIQLLEKVLSAAAEEGKSVECREALRDLFLDQIANKLETTNEVKEVGIDQDYIMDVLGCIDPTNPAVIHRKYKDLMRTVANTINKLSFDCDSYNMVVAGDIAAFFGIRIVKSGEALLGKFSKDNDNSRIGEKAILIKYPAILDTEHLSITVLGIEEACDRVVKAYEANKISEGVMKGLCRYYRNMADSTIMMPAIKRVFKTLAGMDTDFDKILVVFEKIVVDYLFGRDEFISLNTDGYEEVERLIKSNRKVERETVKVSKDNKLKEIMEAKKSGKATDEATDKTKRKNKGKTTRIYTKKSNPEVAKEAFKQILKEKVQFDPNDASFFHEMYVVVSEFEGMIGIITYYNDRCISMKIEAWNGNLDPARKFLEQLYGEEAKDGEEYVSEFVEEVTPMFAYDIVEKMRKCEWNRENIIAFLTDCSRVYRLYQETTIDAAKTGIYLTILLRVDAVTPDSLLNVYYDNETKQITRAKFKSQILTIKDVVINKKGEKEEIERKIETISFADEVSRLQDMLIADANEYIVAMEEEMANSFCYSDELMTVLKAALKSIRLNNKYDDVLSALYIIKVVYFDITDKYIKALTNSDKKGEEEVDTLRLSYQTTCEALGNTLLRQLCLASDNVRTRAELLLALSIMDRKGKQPKADSKTRMPYNLLPGYAFTAVNGDNKYEGVADVIQGGCDDIVGIELDFEKGAALHFDKTILISKDYTGKAIIEKEECSKYDEKGELVEVIDVYRAYADKEIKLEEVNEERFSLIIIKDKDFEVTRDSMIYFENNCIMLDYDAAEEDKVFEIAPIENIVHFDGTEAGEYYVDNITPVDILDGMLYKQYQTGATTPCLVLDLVVPTKKVAQ